MPAAMSPAIRCRETKDDQARTRTLTTEYALAHGHPQRALVRGYSVMGPTREFPSMEAIQEFVGLFRMGTEGSDSSRAMPSCRWSFRRVWRHLGEAVLILAAGSAVAAGLAGCEEPPSREAGIPATVAEEDGAAQLTLEATGIRYTAVATGGSHRRNFSCGLRTDGTAQCWGRRSNDEIQAPEGQLTAITAGYEHLCGLFTDGTADCWGYVAGAPDGKFTAISAGGDHSCGLRVDGAIECWGKNWGGQTDAPAGHFTAVSAGSSHSCGLTTEETIDCWGFTDGGRIDTPEGQFTAISAGGVNSCGLRIDGTIQCWGDNDAPEGQFTAISVGERHSCGLRTDGTIQCWGDNDFGQSDAPSGQFFALSADWMHSCGVRANGVITCWGDNRNGQLDVPSS
ncbi:RCC1 domain-containing protein [Candidatus Poriferisocius sp.]|uniref:RCC1 domain-containing protein n=1 Tax=Candidatus Poriferisocius sp. TaxID=3101276 RepID=UPI003B029A3A